MTTTTPVERARAIHEGLLAKLANAEKRKVEIAQRRASHGWKAYGPDNNRRSKAQIAELNAEFITLAGEIEALEGAVAEAVSRVTQAEQDERRAERAEIARQIRDLVPTLMRHAQAADKHAESLCHSFQALTDTLADLRGLGARHPEHHLVKTHTVWALTTALSAVPLGLAPVPVLQRRSLGYLANAWAQSIRRQSDAIEQGDARAPISAPPEGIDIDKMVVVKSDDPRIKRGEEARAKRDLVRATVEQGRAA